MNRVISRASSGIALCRERTIVLAMVVPLAAPFSSVHGAASTADARPSHRAERASLLTASAARPQSLHPPGQHPLRPPPLPADLPRPQPSEAPPPTPEAVSPPTAAELDVLAQELALLDLAATLSVTVPRDVQTLDEVIAALTAQTNLPIEVDWEGLVSMGIRNDGPAVLAGAQGSLLAVLEAICANVGTTFARPRAEATLGRLRIMNDAAATALRRTRAYRVDLLADDFMTKAREHIDPDSWLVNGGDLLHASRTGGTVLVSAPATIHRRLAALVEELRLTHPSMLKVSVDAIRVPTRDWRIISMSERTEVIRPEAVMSIAGAARVASPTLVTTMDEQAESVLSEPGLNLRFAFRPEWDTERGVRVVFECAVTREGVEAISSGSIAAPIDGPPAVTAVDLPGTEETVVIFLRARPLPRAASAVGL
ncbi:MAG: hypothetical protein KF724_03970 [Phycisphaeraceae bacterium]|nr:hypothetical protein [Phycisphaeraceae bacterium]